MPTVLRWNGFRFYFFSNEGDEPAHIHVDKAGSTAKFWLDGVSLALNRGFNERDLATIRDKILAEREPFLRAWNEHFSHD
jgi:hypothetical protein